MSVELPIRHQQIYSLPQTRTQERECFQCFAISNAVCIKILRIVSAFFITFGLSMFTAYFITSVVVASSNSIQLAEDELAYAPLLVSSLVAIIGMVTLGCTCCMRNNQSE